MAAGNEKAENPEHHEDSYFANVHEDFREADEVKGLISSLPDIYKDQVAVEMSAERFTYIIDLYQEQPHLIDSHLESILNQLLTIGRNLNAPRELQDLAFKYLYLITKMRGAKVVVRLFPHEVVDVEPVLALLSRQNPENHAAWESRYVLLLWLSMACMIPFDLSRLDSNVRLEGGDVKKPVMDRILDIGKSYLTVADKSRDAAAYLMSRFMTRPDVKKAKLPEFIDWTLKCIDKADYSTLIGAITLTGLLRTLGQLFKHGKREDLLQYTPNVLEKMESLDLADSNNTLLRKMRVKVIQRLGLTFLQYRVAAWRYQRGSRSLADNLQLSKEAVLQREQGGIGPSLSADEEEEYDIPDEIENVIEQLLMSLKDKDTVVRWSAAKGIGRITGRLPKELADEVVGSLMDLFNLQESDGAWHGGCLALAELGRRGLLLPQRLSDVVPVVLKALAYDERRGNFSVGAHVRDAACYVCWAFARAYDPKEIKTYVNEIASALIIVSIFDKEINVRRAASAAFQENVGRQGTFPYGIEIVTTADYFAVGNQTHCYLELSVFVAQYEEYTIALINHLAEVKIGHWVSGIRELAAKALHNLTEKAPEHLAKTVLPSLIPKATCTDLHLRHGAILAAAEVTHALSVLANKQNRSLSDLIGKDVIEGLRDITRKLHEAKLFRGLGGELMRKAVTCLIEKVSLSKLPYHKESIIDLWQEILDDCLAHTEPEIQMAAVAAIPAFFTEYYMDASGRAIPQRQDAIIEKYLRELRSNVEVTRMGYSLALGALPKFMLSGKLRAVLSGLIGASEITKKEEKWAEGRRDALKAITCICTTVGVDKSGDPTRCLCSANIGQLYEAFLTAMKDYTLDSRGDVGAWVREASMSGLQDITSLIVKHSSDLLQPQLSEHIFKSLVQQCCEKIDRTRAIAGHAFSCLLYHSPAVPGIPNRQEVENIFPRSEIELINWSSPAVTFPRFIKFLQFPVYRYSVLLGLTVSVGGLTESLVKQSSISMYSYLRSIGKDVDELTKFTQVLTQIFKDYQKVDRVSIPMLKMLDQLLSRGSFDTLIGIDGHPFPEEVLTLVKAEINRSGDPQKLMASADVFCGLLHFPSEVRKKCLFNLAIFLCHRYPREMLRSWETTSLALELLEALNSFLASGEFYSLLITFANSLDPEQDQQNAGLDQNPNHLIVFLKEFMETIRKTTANKLYEVLVSYDDIAPIENLEEIMMLLSETLWDAELDEIRPIRNNICKLLEIQTPVPKKAAAK